jgi:hypothetical protein
VAQVILVMHECQSRKQKEFSWVISLPNRDGATGSGGKQLALVAVRAVNVRDCKKLKVQYIN